MTVLLLWAGLIVALVLALRSREVAGDGVVRLDREESRWLLHYMDEQENLPPEAMERKRRFLLHCKATALYIHSFGRLPDWSCRSTLYDNPVPY